MTTNRRFLVTAGSTREMIDRVRDWGNIFTGNTGLRIATVLKELGDVELFTSNRDHLAQIGNGATFGTHAQLKSLLEERMSKNHPDVVFMTAAVSDYSPAGAFAVLDRRKGTPGEEIWVVKDAQAGKVKSDYDEVTFLARRTEKLVD